MDNQLCIIDPCKQSMSRAWDPKSDVSHHNGKLLSLTHFPCWSSSLDQGPIVFRKDLVILGKDHIMPSKYVQNWFPYSFPKGPYSHLSKVTVYQGVKNTQMFLWFGDTGSEMTLIPGPPKCHCGPSVKIGIWKQEDQSSLGWSPSHSGSFGSTDPPVIISPSLKIGENTLSSW